MKVSVLAFFLILNVSIVSYAETKKEKTLPLFTWDLLWAGSWYNSFKTETASTNPQEDVSGEGDSTSDSTSDSTLIDSLFAGGTLSNRGNLTLSLPMQDLSLRFLATDKRLLPPSEDDGKAGFNPALGLYHQGSGSRILYGVQSEYGLPARINNVWIRSAPFIESRQPSSRDLKAEPSASDKNETYLYLGLPGNLLQSFDAFAYAALDDKWNPAFGGGVGWINGGTANGGTANGLVGRFLADAELRLEGFYAKKVLPPRKASAWFSSAPPLPERDFHIYGLSAFFYLPNFAFASDWAYSETFAWGSGLYGNAALRIGNKPWRFSLAADGAMGRFADRGGSTAGEAFRVAAKGERFWPRSGLLRFQGTLRSPGPLEGFNRGNLSVYFRPSAPNAAERRASPNRIRFSRASLSFNRDARKPEKSTETISANAAFSAGPLSSVFSGSFHSLSCLSDETLAFPLFGFPVFESFDSFEISGELAWRPNLGSAALDLRTRLGYTVRAEKDPLWGLSVNGSVRTGKWGRVGLKIASTDFPEKWNYTMSWRFAYGGNLPPPKRD